MKDSSKDEARGAQPWHAADEKPAAKKGGPLGTPSFTGSGANMGLPASPRELTEAERGEPRDVPPGAQAPDPLAEPRAATGEILGRKDKP